MKSLFLPLLLALSPMSLAQELPSKPDLPEIPLPDIDGKLPPPPKPVCIQGEEAQEKYASLEVKAKVKQHGNLTSSVKREKAVSCRELKSEEQTS